MNRIRLKFDGKNSSVVGAGIFCMHKQKIYLNLKP